MKPKYKNIPAKPGKRTWGSVKEMMEELGVQTIRQLENSIKNLKNKKVSEPVDVKSARKLFKKGRKHKK